MLSKNKHLFVIISVVTVILVLDLVYYAGINNDKILTEKEIIKIAESRILQDDPLKPIYSNGEKYELYLDFWKVEYYHKDNIWYVAANLEVDCEGKTEIFLMGGGFSMEIDGKTGEVLGYGMTL